MAITIKSNNNGRCILFEGTTMPAYWYACLRAEVDGEDPTRINVINDVRSEGGTDKYEFYKVPYTSFIDEEGNGFADAPATAQYINDRVNPSSTATGGTTFAQTEVMDFERDSTNTTIMFSNGDSWGVNSVKAIDAGDGTISIVTTKNQVPLYEGLNHENLTIALGAAGSTLNGAVNALNAYFSVTPVGDGGDYVPSFPTLDGVAVTGNDAEGTTPLTGSPPHLLTTGSDTSSGHGARYWSDETIDAAGEYYTVKMTGQGRFILGLVDAANTDDIAELSNNSGNGHSGLLWGLAVYDYGNYKAPWTTYGSGGLSYGPGWTGAQSGMMRYNTTVQDAFDNMDPVLFKVGIDANGYVAVWYWDDARSNDWILCSRRGQVTPAGNYKLVVKLWDQNCTLVETPLRYAVDPAAPTLNYRYIESPDGVFHYPLFATEEEANYVDTDNGGAGESTSEVFVDEPTNTTWYSPVTGYIPAGIQAPLSSSEVTYTVIPTEADNLHLPPAFTAATLTLSENEVVNYQTQPQDTAYTTLITGLPGDLAATSDGRIVGTTRYVTGDETTTVTVSRTNAFGTSTGTFDIVITDNVSLNTLTGWTALKADQIAHQPDNVPHYGPEAGFDLDLTLDEGTELSWTQTNVSGPVGGPGQYLQIGIVGIGVDKAVATLGNNTSNWSLKAVIWTGLLNNNSPVGWVDNSRVETGDNSGVVWKLSYEQDGADYKIVLYRSGVEVARSAAAYSGSQTVTVAIPTNYSTSIRLPAITRNNIGAGSTDAPAGFVSPLTEGTMDSLTALGSDAVATLDMVLEEGRRVILPQAFVETNVLPNLDESLDKGYFAVPKTSADWGDIDLHTDFDAVVRWEWQSGDRHKLSQSVGDSASANHATINSSTDAYYDYAIEWDGEDLHVIACNINDLNDQPGVANGGTFTRAYTYSGYADRAGDLPLVFATKSGGSVNLTTSGIQNIRIPFGVRDIVVGENSGGNGRFAVQPTGSTFDDVPSGHAPASYGDGSDIVLNADNTYRFIYHPSMEANDSIEFRLASDQTTVYTTGITTFDGTTDGDPKIGEGYKGISFAVPSDAPPLRLYFKNNTSYDAGRGITISGSTYVTPVTGVANEGPAGNYTGNVINGGDGNHGWVSVSETLAAGERLVMNTAFLTDLVSAMPNGSYVYVGVKDTSWDNDVALDTYSPILIVGKLTDSDVRLNFTGSTQAYMSLSTLTSSGQEAFLEITSSGNNVRGGYGTQDASSVAYADWSSGAKNQTGDQGYGLTTAEVGFMWLGLPGNTTGFDITDVDWTGLSEVSIPSPAATLTTNWTKALDFSGSAERLQQEGGGSVGGNPLQQNGTGIAMPASGQTASTGDARPWAVSCVFRYDGHNSNQVIWAQSEGAGSTDDSIMLSVNASDEVVMQWGRDGAISQKTVGTFSPNTWYGIYVDYNGFRTGSPTVSQMAEALRIKTVNLSSGVVTTVTGDWDSSARITRAVTGNFFVGGRDANRSFHGKVASVVVTALVGGVALPTDAEISMMVRDPMEWLTVYKVGNSYRVTGQSYSNSDFQLNNIGSARNTQVWLMGDGASDAYAVIRNSVMPSDQNWSATRMISMVSNDIETVTIPGLS